jgi:predicted protein tyrosine phosphatase
MIEIYSRLWVGNQTDYESSVRSEENWRVVHACKEPYHRDALGYRTRAVAKTHPEYLIARRANRLILNLIDADDPKYIPKEIIDAAIEFIGDALKADANVLVHCNQGESRGPSIGFLYLVSRTDQLPSGSLEDALVAYRRLYPAYNPARGMAGFIRENYFGYRGRTLDGENHIRLDSVVRGE